MKISTKIVSSALTKSNLPDADFVINPYVGCQHACIYCYADFIKRFTGHSSEKWGQFVDVKINAAETIRLKNYLDKTILLGSVTDPYQPLEAKYKITQQILQKLLVFQPKLEILTKSSLILRDINLLKKFSNLKVGISINSLDDNFARLIEPLASSPTSRIATLEKLHSEGIKTYLFISPIFPFITDYKELLKKTKSSVDRYLFENLNLRANNTAEVLKFIRNYNSALLPFYKTLSANNNYWVELEDEIIKYCNSINIPFKIYFYHTKAKK